MQQLEIDVIDEGAICVVEARGEIDLGTIALFRETLNELIVMGSVNLVVDLDQVTFLDSTGLGVLIGARRRIHAYKGTFSLVCKEGGPMKVFRITGLDKVFTFHTSRADALQELAST